MRLFAWCKNAVFRLNVIPLVIGVALLNSMSPEEKQNLISPYFKNLTDLSNVEIHKFITERRHANLLRKCYTVNISFTYCLPEITSLMVNKFADFFCDFSMKIEPNFVLKSINDLTSKVASQKKVIEDQERKLYKYREACSAISLESKDDVAHQRLFVLKNAPVSKKLEYDLFKKLCLPVEEYMEKGKQLMTLPFVCSNNYMGHNL